MYVLLFIIPAVYGATILQTKFIPESKDIYEIKEHIVLTSDLLNADDYDFMWPSEVENNVLGRDQIHHKDPNSSGEKQEDYDYFFEAKLPRGKKQLNEGSTILTETTTQKINLTESQVTNETEFFNYTEKDEDDKLDSMISGSIDQKICAGSFGIGIAVLSCVNTMQGSEKARAIMKFLTFWILFGIIIVLCFWCTKGWCCCCCPIPFCKVNDRLQATYIYLAENPPGRLKDENGIDHDYDPTVKEKLMYENMTRSFMVI